MPVIEYLHEVTHEPLYRDRSGTVVPPIGSVIVFPSDRAHEVTGILFDYHTNPELWICVLVKARPATRKPL